MNRIHERIMKHILHSNKGSSASLGCATNNSCLTERCSLALCTFLTTNNMRRSTMQCPSCLMHLQKKCTKMKKSPEQDMHTEKRGSGVIPQSIFSLIKVSMRNAHCHTADCGFISTSRLWSRLLLLCCAVEFTSAVCVGYGCPLFTGPLSWECMCLPVLVRCVDLHCLL